MASLGRGILFGFFVWLGPFLVAFGVFRLKESWPSLFESIMPIALSLVVVIMALAYFRRVRSGFIKEGALLGSLWLVICVLIDVPLMLSPPMSMTLVEYTADVGLTYLMIPIITTGIAAAFAQANRGKTV